jgi:hypothetical protein
VNLVEYHTLDRQSLLRTLQERPLAASDLDAPHWRTMVELVTQRIQSSTEPLEWIAWSPVVVDLLARSVEAGAYARHQALIRRLNLTSLALECTDRPDEAVALLGLRGAIDLVLEALPTDLDAVASAATGWTSLPNAEIAVLRGVKNLLTPALRICGRWGDPRLDGWRVIYPTLP